MDTALVLGRLLLATVFVVAGLSKLFDLAGSRRALADFGLPPHLATPLGLLLPLAELAVAVALLPARTAWWGALGALALLLVFVAGIGANLARGRRPDCHCFGQLHSAPAGPATLVRNAILAAIAAFVLWQGGPGAGPSIVDWVGGLASGPFGLIGGLTLWGVVIAEGCLLLLLLRQHGKVLRRLDALEARASAAAVGGPVSPSYGLPVGSPAPSFSLPDLDGELVTSESLRAADRPLLLIFANPYCGPCNALMPDVGHWQRDHGDRLTIAVVSEGTPEENRPKAEAHGVDNVLLQRGYEIATAFGVPGTPSAVLVRPDGTIGSVLAGGVDEIRALVSTTLAAEPAAGAPLPEPADGGSHDHAAIEPTIPLSSVLGQRAPTLRLPDLDGRMIDLADFRGSKVLVLFWSPTCGFCQRMLPDLKAWEANPPPGAPKLLVVSNGTVELNRAQAIAAPIVLDEDFETGFAFGADGTPAAVLIDDEGNVASPVAGGAPEVLALANGDDPRSAVGSLAAAQPIPREGDSAPVFTLPDLDGRPVELAGRPGRHTVLLFWNPGCSFCQAMLPDLRTWESDPPAGAADLIVVSAGSPEENRAMGLKATVVLDDRFEVGRAFGASGTPMAVLIDREGRVGSPVVPGAEAVFELLNEPEPAEPSLA